MAEESFLLVSLKEEKSKKLAQVISNETSRKILDFLSRKTEATETEIAKEMNLPISTIHYNLQHLVDTKLVQVDEFHYSKKGKEINHYKLSNKFIIIAPSGMDKMKDKLRSLFPITIIAVAAAGLIHLFSNFIAKFGAADKVMFAKMTIVADESIAAERALAAAPQTLNNIAQTSHPNIALWFLIGAIFVIIVILIWEMIKKVNNN